MFKKILIIVNFSVLSFYSYSQNTGYKYQVSKKVFDAIVSAYGSNRNAPELEVRQKDFPVVQGGVLLLALTFSLVNLIVDIMYAYIDPRIKAQYK